MRGRLPDGHLAWFVIEAVGELELSEFYACYGDDGTARPAYDPEMMVALTLNSYASGVCSPRKIEARCHEDVAFRVICAGARPDHATIVCFRSDHEQALAQLFTQILALCAAAGMGSVDNVALDSTKIAAAASRYETRTSWHR
jgi:transposase